MNVSIVNEESAVIVKVEGSINSANASEFENALKDYPKGNESLIIDARNLEYISSAGLRVILKAKKRCVLNTFKVINVSSDVKNIFDVTGFSEIIDVQAAARTISVDGCKMIGHGACGECFRIDDETIVKLYYSKISDAEIETEKSLAKKAFVLGIPTAISYDIVECDGRKGVVYELIKSKTISELIREDYSNHSKYVRMYTDICKKVHSIHTDDKEIPSFKEVNRADIKKIIGISDEEIAYLHKFIDIIPDDDTCIHGDLNINNIMVENGEPLLIDMGELSTGISLFDISRIIFSMKYANPSISDEIVPFYKLTGRQVDEIYNEFILDYFGCDLDTAIMTVKYGEWLMPLTWFRCCTSMIRGDRFPKDKVDMALSLLRDNLIPFIKEHE